VKNVERAYFHRGQPAGKSHHGIIQPRPGAEVKPRTDRKNDDLRRYLGIPPV